MADALMCKNLFLKDKKKTVLVLLVALAETNVDLRRVEVGSGADLKSHGGPGFMPAICLRRFLWNALCCWLEIIPEHTFTPAGLTPVLGP
jgi:hypothetical protein